MKYVLLALLSAVTIAAHDLSKSFLRLEISRDRIAGCWEVELRDLEIVVGLDVNEDDTVTSEEVRLGRPKLQALVRKAISLAGERAQVELTTVTHRPGSSGNFLALGFDAPIDTIDIAALNYNFMFEYDAGHRAIATIVQDGRENVVVLTKANRTINISGSGHSSFFEFIRQGIIHIWEGTDHILFVVALLIPAVIRRNGEKLHFREAFVRVVKVVTAFTLAHSLTLTLAAIGLVRLPGRIVESVIAFSVLLAAANNIMRIWDDRSWLLAFLFGLIHGFGFASVLAELDLGRTNFLGSILGFNAGVEVGQIAIVAVLFPIAFLMRESWFYRRLVNIGASSAIMLVASLWIIERAFSVALFSTIPTLLR